MAVEGAPFVEPGISGAFGPNDYRRQLGEDQESGRMVQIVGDHTAGDMGIEEDGGTSS